MSESQPKSIFERIGTAAAEGDVQTVKAILGEQPAPTTADLHQAMIQAAAKGQIDTVKMLLDHGVDPNAPNKTDHGAPANYSLQNGHFDVVNLQLDRGCDLSENSATADMNVAGYALHSGNEELTNRVYLHGARPNIYAYVRANRLVVLAELLDYCPDVPCKRPDGWDRTILETIRSDAAWLGNADAMSMVLEVRPELGTSMRKLVGDAICSHNRIFPPADYLRNFRMLMDHAPDHLNDNNFLPLHWLAQENPIEGQTDFVDLFLEYGVEVDRLDSENNHTALYDAVKHQRVELVELLLNRNADPTIASKDPQETALQCAERIGSKEIVERLKSNSE